MKKTMHAKHADDASLNEPSGDTIGFAFTVHNALGTMRFGPAYTTGNQTRNPRPCEACRIICVFCV
ncbi:MAG TPA: hypothetical protein VFE41_35820, partial [Acetobacteraceae bacterium]|nr:hypothetical protein [Acetobacteraceae bacterium]